MPRFRLFSFKSLKFLLMILRPTYATYLSILRSDVFGCVIRYDYDVNEITAVLKKWISLQFYLQK